MTLGSDETPALSEMLAEAIAAASYNDIPPSVVTAVKMRVVDTVGVSLAAIPYASNGAGLVHDLVADWGGKPDSTLWGTGTKVPAWSAAFANGALAHALDFDTTFQDALVHPSAPVIPAALAMAELTEASGPEFLTAVLVGEEVTARLGLAIACRERGWAFDWHNTILFGTFGATAACSQLLQLDRTSTRNALSIALMMCAGTMEIAYGAESELRLIYDGFPNKSGVLAATMAAKGLDGPRRPLEGDAGLFATYFGGDYDVKSLTNGLGTSYVADARVAFKPWPACGAAHPYIQAALELRSELEDVVDHLSDVTVHVGDFSRRLCEPLAARQRPKTVNDAKYSIPYVVAVALIHGCVDIEHFTPRALQDESVLKLAAKVQPTLDPALTMANRTSGGSVTLNLRGGESRRRDIDYAWGDPLLRPMSEQEVSDKFVLNLRSAAALGFEFPGKLLDELITLEQHPCISPIGKLMTNVSTG